MGAEGSQRVKTFERWPRDNTEAKAPLARDSASSQDEVGNNSPDSSKLPNPTRAYCVITYGEFRKALGMGEVYTTTSGRGPSPA